MLQCDVADEERYRLPGRKDRVDIVTEESQPLPLRYGGSNALNRFLAPARKRIRVVRPRPTNQQGGQVRTGANAIKKELQMCSKFFSG